MNGITSEKGSALVVGLILLICLTVLGMAGMRMSTVQLAMAANSQFFTAAQTTLHAQTDLNMDRDILALNETVTNHTLVPGFNATNGSWTTTYLGATAVPGGGFSLNGSFSAVHYQFSAVATNAATIELDHGNVQGAYMIGPGK